jgi:LmbE family N-acetylglucosaminyl deacetylase
MALSAFGILSKNLLPRPWHIVTVFSYSNYVWMPGHMGFARQLMRSLAVTRFDISELGSSFRNDLTSRSNTGFVISRVKKAISDSLNHFATNPALISRIRRYEDEKFCRLIGANVISLDFPDSFLRGYNAKTYESPKIVEQDFALVQNIKDSIDGVLENTNCQLIVSVWPFGELQHIDHRLCFEAASHAAMNFGTELALLDDRLYSRRPVDHDVLEPATGINYRPLVLKLDRSTLAAKLDAISIYKSQMKAVFFTDPGKPLHGQTMASETLWVPFAKESSEQPGKLAYLFK